MLNIQNTFEQFYCCSIKIHKRNSTPVHKKLLHVTEFKYYFDNQTAKMKRLCTFCAHHIKKVCR